MTNEMRVLVGPGAMTRSVEATIASGAPMVVLTFAAIQDLIADLGGEELALRWLQRRLDKHRAAVFINFGERSVCIGPSDWTPARLKGYVAIHLQRVEREFGEISEVS